VSYLIDSDRVIDVLTSQREARRLIRAVAVDGLVISLITYGEVLAGVYYSRDSVAAKAGFRSLLRDIDVLPIDELVIVRFARIYGGLRNTGNAIDATDALVAATAIEHNLTLVTRNLRHYRPVPGLALNEPA
jgi:predicted nucleic acid-binding protein